MPYNAGTAYLQVIPSFLDVEKNIAKDLRKMARGFGAELEKQLPKALTDALAKASKDVEKDAGKAAADLAAARAQTITKVLEKANEEQTRSAARAVKKQGDLYAGLGHLRRKLAERELREYDKRNADYARLFEEAEARNTRAQEKAEQERRQLIADSAEVRLKYARQEIADRERAIREIQKAEEEAYREERRRADKAAEEMARRAEKRMEQLRREQAEQQKLMDQARRAAQAEADRQFRGTTAGRAQAGARAGAEAIQYLPVHLNDASIYGELQAIRQRIKSMGDLEIGVDIDVEDFADNIEREFNRLRQIATDLTVDIDVRTDAASAATELGAVLVLLNRIDGQDANVDVNVDVDSARARMVAFAQSLEVNFSRLGNLIALGASLGSAIVPAAAMAAAGIAAIGAAALGAASGIGVLALGFGGVGEAVKALSSAADDQDKINKSLVASENQVANAVDGVKSARAALANTIANNRDAAIRANQAVADAERALARARREADRQAEEAARRVSDARLRAARDAEEAAERVASAQRSLARDERDVLRAREDLTRAYREAERAYDDVGDAIRRNSLDQRQAVLDLAEAEERLQRVMNNPRATQADREQALIDVERMRLRIEELGETQDELNQKQIEYNQTGIEGSREVTAARERLQSAEESLADSQRALAEAQEDQQQAMIDGQRAIADAVRAQQEQQERSQEAIRSAEQRLANERRDRDAQQRQAAYSLAQAQQSLIQSQRSLENAYASAALAGGAALDKVNTAMSKLSPTAQRFAQFIFGLRDEFYALRGAAADGMLGGLQTAIETLLPYLPEFTQFVRGVSAQLGSMFVRWAEAMKEPVFRDFFDYIGETAVPNLELLFQVSMNLLRGLTGLFLGLTPFTEDFNGGLLEMSESFAEWGTTLDQNSGFQTFLQYIRDNGPTVIDFFGTLIEFGAKLIQAMAPIGPVVLKILDGFINFLASLPPDVLAAIVAGIAGLAAALGVLSAATSVAAISTTAFVVAGVVAAVAAAVAGITLLFKRSEPLRSFFVGLWQQIVSGAQALWAQVAPILASLGDSLLRLWNGAALPAFRGIWEVMQAWWAIVSPIFGVVMDIIKLVAGVVIWLWKNIWAPAFANMVTVITKVIVPVISWFWKNIIKPTFDLIAVAVNVLVAAWKVGFGTIQIVFKILSAIVMAFWNSTIKPVWNWMKPFFQWLAEIIEKHVKPRWDSALKALGDFWERLRKAARTPIRFVVETLLNNGILAGYNKLADMFDVKPKNVKIPTPEGGWATGGVIDGGVLPGYTPGRDVHTFVSPTGGAIGLSGGEGILRPEVTALVRPWLDSANKAAREGGRQGAAKFLGGFARGGVVPGGGDGLGAWWDATKAKAGDKLGDLWGDLKEKSSDVFTGIKDFASDPAGYLKKIFDKLVALVPGRETAFVKAAIGLPKKLVETLRAKVANLFTGNQEGGAGTPGSAGGLGGSAGMMRILRQAFPGLPLISGYRPGAITATGNPSMHGKNRAVDLPPRMDVFNWLRANYPNSHELIFSPAGGRQLYRGRPHVYSGITRQMHYNHVHWSYDDGGWLPDTRQMPGQQMAVFHGRRQPDAVLTNDQWSNVSRLVTAVSRQGTGRGDTYQFDFANSTLDAARLNSIQSRRDTLDRINRPNW